MGSDRKAPSGKSGTEIRDSLICPIFLLACTMRRRYRDERRCVLPGVPYHVTQRGVDRRETFSVEEDRQTYLHLLRDNLTEAGVRVWAWCLMTNHVHLVLVPAREDSLSVLLRRVHGRYAQYYNAHWGRCGQRWRTSNGIQCELASLRWPSITAGRVP